MSKKIKTYNPKEVTVSCGSHIVEGFADDSFITIEFNGDGITKKVGCDGEIFRPVTATPISARRWTRTGTPATGCSPSSSKT